MSEFHDLGADDAPLNRPLLIADRVLEKLEASGACSPGTRTEVLGHIKRSNYTSPASAVAMVWEIVDGPGGGRYRSPTHTPPADPLERVVGMLPITQRGKDRIRKELALQANSAADIGVYVEEARRSAAADGLAFDERRVQAEARSKVTARIAEMAIELLDERDYHDHWVGADVRPPVPYGERLARKAIEAFREFMHLDATEREDLARQWGREFGGMSELQARQMVATRLQMPVWAKGLCRRGEPASIPYDHEGYQVDPAEQELQRRATNELRRNPMYQRM